MRSLAIVALLVSGCAQQNIMPTPIPTSYDFYEDSTVDAFTHAAIGAAAADWTSKTGAVIRLHDGTHDCAEVSGCFVVSTMTEEGLTNLTDNPHEDVLGAASLVGHGFLVVQAGLPLFTAAFVADHEMGHALGLPHSCAAGVRNDSVMNPYYGYGSADVTALDVDVYDSVRVGM
jgi:hypothetical protein